MHKKDQPPLQNWDSRFREGFAEDVLKGFSATRKALPCKYIYDRKGSELFKQIMMLPEYYLTRCEAEILSLHGERISKIIGNQPVNLIELGAGNGEKTRILARQFMRRRTGLILTPIDISRSAIETFKRNMKAWIPGIEIRGLNMEYFKGLRWLSAQNQGNNLILFLGSNIGNFEPGQADDFLCRLREACSPEDFILIGFDLIKDIPILLDAYNDSQGITALFNLNLLERINRELGGHFDTGLFAYSGIYDSPSGSIRSYLESRKHQTVAINQLGRTFSFRSGETIHTESSYKFQISDIEALAGKNGFSVVDHFFDTKRYFVDSLWQVGNP
jgi:dimethylhistidine N-methyltransferase